MGNFILVFPLCPLAGRELSPHGHFLVGSGYTLGLLDVTGAALRTTVNLILTAHSLGHGAAPPTPIWSLTACGSLWTLRLSVTAHHCNNRLCLFDAGAAVCAALVAFRTAMFPIRARHSMSNRTATIACSGLQTGELFGAVGLVRTDVIILIPGICTDHSERFRIYGLFSRDSLHPW